MLLEQREHLLSMEYPPLYSGLFDASHAQYTEVFAQPLQDRATAVIVAHNHPSGNLDPSKEDMSVTRRLSEAGAFSVLTF